MAERFEFIPQTTVEGVAAECLRVFDDDARWTVGWMARTEDGEDVPEYSPRACKWCLVGAVICATPDHGIRNRFVAKFREATGSSFLAEFNDKQGLAAVRAVLRKIAKVE